MSLGHRHQSLRRKAKIPTLTHKGSASLFDKFVYLVVLCSMLSEVDQIRIIWFGHNAAGVSLTTWTFFTFTSSVWCLYGYLHKDKVIFITSLIWIMLDGLVALGIVVYGT